MNKTYELEIPSGIMGKIIWFKGKTINSIRDETKSSIRVHQPNEKYKNEWILIRGKPDQINNAVYQIKQIINSEQKLDNTRYDGGRFESLSRNLDKRDDRGGRGGYNSYDRGVGGGGGGGGGYNDRGRGGSNSYDRRGGSNSYDRGVGGGCGSNSYDRRGGSNSYDRRGGGGSNSYDRGGGGGYNDRGRGGGGYNDRGRGRGGYNGRARSNGYNRRSNYEEKPKQPTYDLMSDFPILPTNTSNTSKTTGLNVNSISYVKMATPVIETNKEPEPVIVSNMVPLTKMNSPKLSNLSSEPETNTEEDERLWKRALDMPVIN